jgi:hypothetical protein
MVVNEASLFSKGWRREQTKPDLENEEEYTEWTYYPICALTASDYLLGDQSDRSRPCQNSEKSSRCKKLRKVFPQRKRTSEIETYNLCT